MDEERLSFSNSFFDDLFFTGYCAFYDFFAAGDCAFYDFFAASKDLNFWRALFSATFCRFFVVSDGVAACAVNAGT